VIVKDDLLPAGLNHGTGRSGGKADVIVLHVTEGSASSVRSWFRNPAAKVSSHYLVTKARELYRFVVEADTAWANGRIYQPATRLVLDRGDRNPNSYTISVEHEGTADGEWPETMYEDSAQLVAEIAARWRIPLDRDHVVGHREIYAKKTCPGRGDVGLIVRMANALIVPDAPTARVLKFGDRGEDVLALQKRLGVKPTSGYFGPVTLAAVQVFQRAHGLADDGDVGAKTRAKLGL